MKRAIALLLLSASVLVAGWDAPPPIPGDEPPVRLKKKKKDKPEKIEPGQPEADPMPPRKPKLDDIDLDPRDEVKRPTQAEPAESAILKRLARNTRLSEEKLGKRELGEPTTKIQDDILKDIDQLIKEMTNQQNQQSSKSSESAPSAGASSKQDPGQQRQARQRERNQRRGQQQAQRSPREQEEPGKGQDPSENPKGGGDSTARGKLGEPDQKFDLWGHLPEKERALMNKEMEQRFMEKYDDLTKQYYRTIAEKSRK